MFLTTFGFSEPPYCTILAKLLMFPFPVLQLAMLAAIVLGQALATPEEGKTFNQSD